MFKNMIFLWIILAVGGGFKESVMARSFGDDQVGTFKHSGLPVHVKIDTGPMLRGFSAAENANQLSKGKEFEALEEELKRLTEEMKRLKNESKEKIQKELIPRIKKEIEKIRKWLREFRFEEDDESEPLRVRKEQIQHTSC